MKKAHNLKLSMNIGNSFESGTWWGPFTFHAFHAIKLTGERNRDRGSKSGEERKRKRYKVKKESRKEGGKVRNIKNRVITV